MAVSLRRYVFLSWHGFKNALAQDLQCRRFLNGYHAVEDKCYVTI